MNLNYLALMRHREGQLHLRDMQQSTTPYHTLYMVEPAPEVQDPATGLWVVANDPQTNQPYDPPEVVTQIIGCRVVLGGEEKIIEGGSSERLGDAVVTNIRRDYYPLDRVLKAAQFRLDGRNGEAYEILSGHVAEVGHNQYSVILARMSQPRAATPGVGP